MKHRWKWSGNFDGRGKCVRCSLKTKVVKRRQARVQVYVLAGHAADDWTETLPPCQEVP